ncbi:uncharacterized protein LOC100204117 isoform X2 [Hydra vulgaris]|uniref:uncharacterized protein LOC100204117 isoform X2 n=1 Tax=Hydra vulgaris TaxID=6087 RepID=UPI001F5EFE0C|nr:germination-specific cysteine protease 1 isoform X2 [Hydra vulgaris]
MTNEERNNVEEAKKNFVFYSSFFCRCLILLLSTGVVLVGQYQLAGSILFDHQNFVNKYRRELNNDFKLKPKLIFPKSYHTTGVLKLPYGGIEEPFEAWYSGNNKMSRIDYYGGMDRTYQREDIGEFGFAAKVVPEYSEKKNKTFKGCLHHIGTKKFPIRAQSMVPSPKLFKFKGNFKLHDNTTCWKWEHTFTILTKVNSYTLYTTRSATPKPLLYEMMGYDTLLTSYYDKYILVYNSFNEWKFDFEIFEIPTELHCFEIESTDAKETSVTSFNPMYEFISSHQNEPQDSTNQPSIINHQPSINMSKTDHHQTNKTHFEFVVEILFSQFKNSFSKDYSNHTEHVKRKDIFRHNVRFINTINRQHLPYKLHVNHFADVTDNEMQRYKGLLNESYNDINAKKFEPPNIDFSVTPIPRKLDWREYGAVTDVRSQGICGSCYAYAVTGAIEGALYLKTGDLVDLSEQQIIDCSWGFGNKGCKGGYPYRAIQWIMKHGGISTQESYGKYLAQEGYCHFKNTTIGAVISNYYNITSGNVTEVKMALALYGPVTVLINTQPRSFKFYNKGVYFDEDCDSRLDHAALLIGYGEENGEDYWLIKNSWSPSWGNNGFIKIATRNDNCGVTQKAVVLQMGKLDQ